MSDTQIPTDLTNSDSSSSNTNTNPTATMETTTAATTTAHESQQQRETSAINDWFTYSPIPMPELREKSEIIEMPHLIELSKYLPPRAEGYSWSLAYSTSKMGFSLRSLYRTLAKYEGPTLLIIKDTENVVFGAFTSSPVQPSDSFYGTGETYLFTFHPRFERYPWTGDNLYFIKGNADSVAIGAGDGNFGLWLDEELFHGSSHPCKTFGNHASLSRNQDFLVSTLECWCFL